MEKKFDKEIEMDREKVRKIVPQKDSTTEIP